MPNIGELVGRVIAMVVGAVGESSMRLGPVPTLAILVIPLLVLSLVARPERRWATSGLGALDRIGEAMAQAAESGSDAVVSLGSAGLLRATSSAERLQTLVALSLLERVARAAARAAVPLRVWVNDPLLAYLARGALARAHLRTETAERSASSTVEFIGDGRPLAASVALADPSQHGLSVTVGGFGEEGLLLMGSMPASAGWSLSGTASPSQLAAPLLESQAAIIGPELYQAGAEGSAHGRSRPSAQAANRLILLSIVIILASSVAVGLGVPDLARFLAGR